MIEATISDEDIDELVIEQNARSIDLAKHWRFDDARRHVFKSWDDVQACPGSGKTTLVAAKLLILAKKWKEIHRGICVLTHTNVARDEIISKLHDHPSGFRLTLYPHFIGTIQEFVNKYLGLPYVRDKYGFKRLVEDTEGQLEVRRVRVNDCNIYRLCGNLRRRCPQADLEQIKDYLGSLHYVNAQEDLRFFKQHDSEEISRASSNSDRRAMLASLKEAMCRAGIFQFRDMYAFAEKLVIENPQLILALRKRFPIVFIDEMQDTQDFQDTLLNRIFVDENVRLQRLGDPDQAIFDGIGGEEPNESYNSKGDIFEIKTTHRFGLDICEKIVGLSYNNLDEITSEKEPNRGDCRHTVFIYDDDSQEQVLNAFGILLAESDPEGCWRKVKAVGGVDGASGQIKGYWPSYERNKSVSSPKPKKLIHIARLCQSQINGHVSSNYFLLLQGIVDLFRKADVKTENSDGNHVYFSRRSLIAWLREKEIYIDLRKLLTSWMMGADLDANRWEEQIDTLKFTLDLNELNEEADVFLDFDHEHNEEEHNPVSVTNTCICANGREIEVGTIHSVKGETHDATLILETKYYVHDLHQILPNMIDAAAGHPTTIRNTKFMRKLYVAGSRPRHLLCIALHANHVSREQIDSLNNLGWSVTNV